MSEENEADSVDFSKWIEKGWWTSQEAFCVFMEHPPQNANNATLLNQLKSTDEGRYLIELIGAAEVDRSVEELVFAKPFYFYRASCKAWIEWALTKSSIEIIPELLQLAGINLHKTPRSQKTRLLRVQKLPYLCVQRHALKILKKLYSNPKC